MSRRRSPGDTGVGILDFLPSRFVHSQSNVAVPSVSCRSSVFSLSPFAAVTGGLRVEGAPSPVAGPRSPRSPAAAAAASPFLLPGWKLAGLCLASLHFLGAVFFVMGIPLGPLPVQPAAGTGLLTPQALVQVRRGLCRWQVWAGQPACFPKTQVSSPSIAGSRGAAPWVSARAGWARCIRSVSHPLYRPVAYMQ